jgi:adenosine deaminase
MRFSEEFLRSLPKVVLHDHLDGGLRPATVVELAREVGYRALPSEDPEKLARWFHRGARRGSLPQYLEGFRHTCAVLQTEDALERAAFEMMEDMQADGVVYVETRFAPVFHTERGLHWDEVVSAVLRGLERGREAFGVGYGLIICAMRDMKLSLEMAELAVDFRNRGVVGFDLAGEEGGFPPKKHIDAFHYIQRENFNITIHAGEAFGKESIWQAIQWCGAHRIGHATRLVEDITRPRTRGAVRLGYLAQYVLDKRIPLEICLTSNVDTGAVRSIGEHPFGLLFKERFRVTLNTDDRLMSDTTMTNEFRIARRVFRLTLDDLEKVTINAMKSAFLPHQERLDYIYKVIKPGYRRARRRAGGAQ